MIPFYNDIEMYRRKRMYKFSLSVILGIVILGAVSCFMAWMGYDTIAGVAVGGICCTLPEVIKSIAKNSNQPQ